MGPSAPNPAPNDLEQIKVALELLTGKVSHLITVVETRRVLVEKFDDRLVRAEKLERALGTTALKLAAARAITSLPTAAFAGAVAGLVVAWVFLHSAIALAH
jgi:hypothetical protein